MKFLEILSVLILAVLIDKYWWLPEKGLLLIKADYRIMCKKGYTYLLAMMAGLNLISFYIDHGLLNKMVTAMIMLHIFWSTLGWSEICPHISLLRYTHHILSNLSLTCVPALLQLLWYSFQVLAFYSSVSLLIISIHVFLSPPLTRLKAT